MIRKIPEDTYYFHFYNANPKGRRESDCCIRAISLALDCTWDEALQKLVDIAIKYKYSPESRACVDRCLKANGYTKCPQPKWSSGCKVNGKDFILGLNLACPELNIVICNIGPHHISVIKDGRFCDTWNPSDHTVGNFWIKNEEIETAANLSLFNTMKTKTDK